MYSRGWPKGTNPGERLPKEGGTGDAKAKLPPLPIGAGVGAGAGGLAVPKRVGGGEMRSPSHGGAKAREAALAQVSSPSSKQVPPLPPGTRRRPADGTTASNNPIADGSSRSSQSPRRDSTGSVWMVRPPSGDGAASPRDNAIASPSRGRSVLRAPGGGGGGGGGSRGSPSPNRHHHQPMPPNTSAGTLTLTFSEQPLTRNTSAGTTATNASAISSSPLEPDQRDRPPHQHQESPGRDPAVHFAPARQAPLAPPSTVYLDPKRPLPLKSQQPLTPFAQLPRSGGEEGGDGPGGFVQIWGQSGPAWFAGWLHQGLSTSATPPAVTLETANQVRSQCAAELVDALEDCVAAQRSYGGLAFDEKLQSKRWTGANCAIWRPFTRVTDDFEASARDCEEGGTRRQSFEESRAYLEENLFITHPFHRSLLDLWVRKYSGLAFYRAMDMSLFPMDQEMFEQLQHAQCQYAREVLVQNWVSEVFAIFAQRPEHEWVPPHLHNRFLQSVRCLQAQHLGGMLKATADQIVGLYQDFAGTDDGAAMFIVNMTVSQDARVVYMPDPLDALLQAKDFMDLVRSSVCMIPVVPSSLAKQPGYNNTLIMNSLLAELLLKEAKQQLDDMFLVQMEGPAELLRKYEKYQYVLAEPYYLFPTQWYNGSNWKRYHAQWQEIWDRCDRVADEIELLTESEVDVGMFVAITSGPTDVGLITEVLTEKVLSLAQHIKDTVGSYITGQARKLLAEYSEIDSVFNEDAKDNPKRLIVILELLKGADKRLKAMSAEGRRIREIFDALWDAHHVFSDEEFGHLVQCFVHSATMRDKLAAANTQFRDTKWAVEEDLRAQRNELQSNLLDIMHKQVAEVLTWDSKHMHAQYLADLKALAVVLDDRSAEGVAIIRLEEEFGWPPYPIQLLDDINRIIAMHSLLWGSVARIPKAIKLWQKMCASEVNPDRVLHSSAEWVRDLAVMMVHFGKETPAYNIASQLQVSVGKVTGLTKVLKVWSSPVLMEWHWKEIESVIGQELIDPSVITLGQLEGWNLQMYQAQLEEIEGVAMVEHRLQETLTSMSEQWFNYSLPIRSLGESGTYYVVAVREAVAIIQDQLIKLDSVMNADTDHRYGDDTAQWREKVLYMQNLLEIWWKVQRHFLRIRPIFASRELSVHLNRESLLYQRIDTLWRTTMSQAAFSPSLAAICAMGNLLPPFQTLEQDLVVLNQSINTYLERTRQAIPRLYFPSEPELLDILAAGHNSARDVNSHISRLFPGVAELLLREEDDAFWGVKDAIGEVMKIVPVVQTQGVDGAGVWLPLIEQQLKNSVRKSIDRARKAREGSSRMDWMLMHSQQAIRVASDIFYTDAVESALVDDNRAVMLQTLN